MVLVLQACRVEACYRYLGLEGSWFRQRPATRVEFLHKALIRAKSAEQWGWAATESCNKAVPGKAGSGTTLEILELESYQ
jgi:hypothetical protein